MHLVSDVLSWFFSHTFLNDIESLDALHADTQTEVPHARPNDLIYTVTMVKLSADFKEHLKDDYIRDHQLQRIHNIIVNNDKQSAENHTFLFYEKIDNLIWQIMSDSEWWFCISQDLTSDLLKLAHSFIHYSFNWFFCHLNELFIYKIIKQLKQYIDYCSDY